MRRFIPALQALGISSIPVVGVAAAGWSPATALALYWCENLLGALLICWLIVRHRRLTRKRGHWRGHFGTVVTVKGSKRRPRLPATPEEGRSLLGDFAFPALVFNLAHGLILAFLLGLALPAVGAAPLNLAELGAGLVPLVLILLGGTAVSLVGLRDRSFAWIMERARGSLRRMVLIHLTIIFGVFAGTQTNTAASFFAVFTFLKLLLDVVMSLPFRPKLALEEPPQWVLRRLAESGGKSVEAAREEWRGYIQTEREAQVADEEEVPAEEDLRRAPVRKDPSRSTSAR